LATAVALYYEDKGHYPPAYLADEQGRPMHSWRVLILPYLEARDVYEQYNFSEPWDGPHNRRLAARMPPVFAFSGAQRPGNTTTNYLAIVGPGTVWPGTSGATADSVGDALGTTILIVENQAAGVHWMEPRDLALSDLDFRLGSPLGISSQYVDPAVAMLDTSLYRLKPGIGADVLRALLTANGGEPLTRDDSGDWQWLADGRQRELAAP
jgi:hypothetical protein